ncbi:MAG: nucleotidyl transferase AbiEii/AbiGii toxin family protein [Candidatus Planktophila sp.]|nr:nucleotidyl transferase AbiEii/AbiGii toxin family protein [Candidatus Planktophila sp.]
MLDPHEALTIQQLFSTSFSQVQKDHAISHVLSVLRNFTTDLVFYGGTGLARTFLERGRLSEDIDIFTSNRIDLIRELDSLPELILQEFPEAYWSVKPSQISEPGKALLVCQSGVQIEVQAISVQMRGWKEIPVAPREIHQRYSDVPKIVLKTPTLDGFSAMKLAAWFDRGTSRDLFDLEGLTHLGPVSSRTRNLMVELLGVNLTFAMLDRRVVGYWRDDLAHQTRLEITEEQALSRVLEWWGR